MAVPARTFRILMVSLGAAALVLLCAIGVVAASKSRLSPEGSKAALSVAAPAVDLEAVRLAEEKKSAADRKQAESRIAALEDENAELKEQLKASAATLAEQAKKLATSLDESARLRKDLETARAETADLKQKYERVEVELNEALDKQVENPATAEKPAIAKAQPNKTKVARANGNRARGRNYNYYRSSLPDSPSSLKSHDPGVGPRLSQKGGEASSASDY